MNRKTVTIPAAGVSAQFSIKGNSLIIEDAPAASNPNAVALFSFGSSPIQMGAYKGSTYLGPDAGFEFITVTGTADTAGQTITFLSTFECLKTELIIPDTSQEISYETISYSETVGFNPSGVPQKFFNLYGNSPNSLTGNLSRKPDKILTFKQLFAQMKNNSSGIKKLQAVIIGGLKDGLPAKQPFPLLGFSESVNSGGAIEGIFVTRHTDYRSVSIKYDTPWPTALVPTQTLTYIESASQIFVAGFDYIDLVLLAPPPSNDETEQTYQVSFEVL